MDRVREAESDDDDGPPMPSEADIRASLEHSRQDIAAGRTVALAPVLQRMRATAERVRQERDGPVGVIRPSE